MGGVLTTKRVCLKCIAGRNVNINSYEDVIAGDIINPDDIHVKFDSIGGLHQVKESLVESVILPLKRPELFGHGKLLTPPKGVLLYGPPGTGKTMLAKAIAKEADAVFINVRIPNLMNKWFGESPKLVAALFSLANKLQPAIIFIDEVDSFLGQRRDTDNEIMTCLKTEFMSLWDGFTSNPNAKVMVLAGTNRPSALDEAILRRFTYKFEIAKPNLSERVSILRAILEGERVEENLNYESIATMCEGFSGSDILELCKQAAKFPIRDLLAHEKKGKSNNIPRALTQSDIDKAFSIRKTVSYQKQSSEGLIRSDMGKVLSIPKAESHQCVSNFLGRIKQYFSNLMVQIKNFISGIILVSPVEIPILSSWAIGHVRINSYI